MSECKSFCDTVTLRAMSYKPKKLPKPKEKPETAEKTVVKISPLAVILGSATLIGGIAAIVMFFPRLTVAVSDPPDASQPFSSSITITNTGYLPLEEVGAQVALRRIENVDHGRVYGSEHFGARLFTRSWGNHNLGLDDKFTFAFNDLAGFPFFYAQDRLRAADVAVIVQYRVPLIRMRREKIFPFVARQQTNGNFYWYGEPLPAN
jgi:hypothetical protein